MAFALGFAVPTSFYTSTRLASKTLASQVKSLRGRVLDTHRCTAVSLQISDKNIVRRSANYQPPIWDYDYVQSLNSIYVENVYAKRTAKLKEDVKIMLNKVVDPLEGLELIDDLQRLGVFYHFEGEIKRVLESIHNSKYSRKWNKEDLHATALEFRLLRQHGYRIPQEVFNNFKDDMGNFKACLCEDVKGLVDLYEASYFSVECESILEEARDFATKNLEHTLENEKDIDQDLAILVSHALEVPLHWRVPRLEARWFIDMYERRWDMNHTLLQLAKLDFNMVQATHQEDLKHTSRWDITAMEQLPEYMKICFLSLFNSINEMGYDVLKEQGVNIIPYLQKMWADLCKCYLVEAKWYYSGYTPTFLEYMENAWISISAPVILTHAYFLCTNPITKEGAECVVKYPNIIQWSATILRLADDLGTSQDEMKRGEVPKSIQCYMHETAATEEDARERIKYLIGETWKKINEDRVADSPFSETFTETAMNLARMAQCMYHHGDGHGAQSRDSINHVLSLLINPIPIMLTEIDNCC